MENSTEADDALLRRWLESRQEAAFRTLVGRYAGLALATARRSCGGDEWLAAEASQLTFILLAKKAPSLLGCASLGGWIHRTALMHARNLMRGRHREERKREHWLDSAMELPAADASSVAAWQEMQPVLDAALAALPDKDREAVLLRFYRALGLREVGETLGISADAAQKRIERAMAKLRDYLTRRGCRELGGGTAVLATALAAGMAADAQAAPLGMVAGIMAAQASATTSTTASTSGLGGLFTKSTTAIAGMKTSTLVITPLLALLVAGFWFVSQRSSLGKLEAERDALLDKLAKASALSSTAGGRNRSKVPTLLDQRPIDWEAVAKELNKGGSFAGAGAYLRPVRPLQEQLRAMDSKALLESMAEVDAAALTSDTRRILTGILYDLLAEKDPAAALDRSVAKDGGDHARLNILADWGKRDPAVAGAWLDAQIAAGTLTSRERGGATGPAVARAETKLFYALLEEHPEVAEQRVAAIGRDKCAYLLRPGPGDYGDDMLVPPIQRNFARILRKYFSDKERLSELTIPLSEVEYLGELGTMSYVELEAYFERIEVRPDEFEACMIAFASHSRYQRAAGIFGEGALADVEALRVWTAARAPELAGRVTGAALNDARARIKDLEAIVNYALQRHAAGDGDAVLLPMLEDLHAWGPERARKMINRLGDAAKRRELLENLEPAKAE